MTQALFLAMRSLMWHRGRAAVIVLSLAVTLWLPVTVRLLLQQFRSEISARAAETPLVVGAPGSRLDLALHALYFEASPPALTQMREVHQLNDEGLGTPIPLHIRFRTQSGPGVDGAPIVGTAPEYFEFRKLQLAAGEPVSLLGECVVGAAAAQRLKVGPGDSLFSAPRNALDLAGDYPLKMRVAGILAASDSPDDDAVFTDIRTAWVIEGIGHGHQEIGRATDPALLLTDDDHAQESRSEQSDHATEESHTVTANAGVLPYTEITADNVNSFHFHGDPDDFPVSAIIVVPPDDKSRTRLLGRYAARGTDAQCLKPPDVIEELLGVVFRIEQFAQFSSLAALAVTLVLLSLVLRLSMKLREAEMQTLFRLGCSRGMIAALHATEIGLMLLAAAALAGVSAWCILQFAGRALRQLLF